MPCASFRLPYYADALNFRYRLPHMPERRKSRNARPLLQDIDGDVMLYDTVLKAPLRC